jgi:hypothetical protein
MIRNSYDIAGLLAASSQWRIEAERTILPAMRALCLAEADRCERLVQRSITVPVINWQDNNFLQRNGPSPVEAATAAMSSRPVNEPAHDNRLTQAGSASKRVIMRPLEEPINDFQGR